ncbi:hypothetical protein [Pelagerythrobacter sp.]|uniref:hypothetical protein n=1 Tax=Pelagerythrobacter sp. TaxID=2800702 RepID=UPI0035B2783A
MSALADRRRVLAYGTLFAALACAAPGIARDASTRRFVAPAGAMKLTRVLERDLGDGNAVVVSRSWRVRFVAQPLGYTVEGEQIAVEVAVPPRLEKLAEVERNNPQAGLFPIRLDRAGFIVADPPAELPPIPGLTEAAREHVADRSAAKRAEAMRYVLAVQQAGAAMVSRWPHDLFFPAAPPRSEERSLPISGTADGSLTVSFDGALDPSGERLASARRRIVTRVGDTVRTSLETWRLERLE